MGAKEGQKDKENDEDEGQDKDKLRKQQETVKKENGITGKTLGVQKKRKKGMRK